MKTITNKVLWIFAIGQLGWSLLAGIISGWLVYYYTGEGVLSQFVTQGAIFIGLTVIGLITAFGRIFDAVTDPLIAGFSDRSRNKNGRRIPFMKAIAIPFGAISILVFTLPCFSSVLLNDFMLSITLVIFYLFMTIYCTPYNALIPELGNTQKNRINVSTFISLTYIAGLTISYLIPNIASLLKGIFSEITSVRVAIGILCVIATVCMMIPTIFIKEKDYIDVKPSNTSSIKSLFMTFKNVQFRRFVYSDCIYFFSLTLFQTGLAFYETKLMGISDKYTFLLSVLMTVCSLLLYLPVNKLALKIGKKFLVVFGFFSYCAVFIITSICGKGLFWGVLIAIVAGIPMAILGILPQAVVADIAEADSIDTGEKREGMYFAARTFAFKLGQAVALLVFTSITVSNTEWSYRLTAIIASVCCAIGAVLFLSYNEKIVIKKIMENNKKKQTEEIENEQDFMKNQNNEKDKENSENKKESEKESE